MCEMIHLSKNFLVVNKPYDCLINSNDPGNSEKTVADHLKEQFPELANHSLKHYFRFCHRLDYSTSGALCLGLSQEAARQASEIFSNQQSKKFYLSIVHGYLKDEFISVNKAIGNDTRPENLHKMCTDDMPFCSHPRESQTRILVLERGFYDNKPATKVLLQPLTGRRHQLRIHLHYLGHTIIGDYTYSDRKDTSPHRMFLHSYRLMLPTKVEDLDVTTDDPFSNEIPENNWKPVEIINMLNSSAFDKISNYLK